MLYACIKCGKAGPERYCSAHKPKPWQSSTRRKRLPGNWEKRRMYVLDRDEVCQSCGIAMAVICDHVIAGDDHSYSNLQGLCKPCHDEKTRRERRGQHGRIEVPQRGWPDFVIALVGGPAVGKSWLLDQLTVPVRRIDECGPPGQYIQRWTNMLAWIADHRDSDAIVTESNVISPEYGRALDLTHHLIVEVRVAEDVRRDRLSQRPGSWTDTVYPIGRAPHHTIAADCGGLEFLQGAVVGKGRAKAGP